MFVNRQSYSCALASMGTLPFFMSVSTNLHSSVNPSRAIIVHVSSLLVLITCRTNFQNVTKAGTASSRCNDANSSISNEIHFLLETSHLEQPYQSLIALFRAGI